MRPRFNASCRTAFVLVLASACGGRSQVGALEGAPALDGGASRLGGDSGEGIEAGGSIGDASRTGAGGDGLGGSDVLPEGASPLTESGVLPEATSVGAADTASVGSNTNPNPSADACRNTTFNPQHCGACGHDCSGGACELGACVSLDSGVLASGQLAPRSVVVDTDNVYWVNDGSPVSGLNGYPTQIMKCAKSGCGNHPTALFSGFVSKVSGNGLIGLAVDDKNVYWAGYNYTQGPTGLYACSVQGCDNNPTLLKQIDNFGEIAVNGNRLYGIGSAGQGFWEVYSCSINGCDDAGAGWSLLFSTSSAATNDAGVPPLIGLTVDPTSAYFDYAGLRSCGLANCTPSQALAAENPTPSLGNVLPWQFATDQTNIYWDVTVYPPQNRDNRTVVGQVLSCAKSGCAGSPVALATGLRNPRGLASDGVNVYFAESGGAGGTSAMDGRVSKCAVGGCFNQPTSIASGLNYPNGVAVDQSNVYWTDNGLYDAAGDGRIMMAPK